MKVENVQQITLNEDDIKKAAVNGGVRVPLPSGTVQVVIRVALAGADATNSPASTLAGP